MTQKSYYPKEEELQADWYIVDADGQNLGRLASRIAQVLMGKHKPSYTPGVNGGDFVIVTNCQGLQVTGNKLDDKIYYRHSNYPAGLKQKTLRQMLDKTPERVIERAVWGMLPKNKMGRKMLKKLKAYGGSEHPHGPQQPKPLELD